MGLLDRFVPQRPVRPPHAQGKSVSVPAPAPRADVRLPEEKTAAPAPAPEEPAPSAAGGVLGRLKDAREAFARKDPAGAVAIYEEVLAVAGDRADVLVSISGELTANGCPRQVIDLVAPHYDAQRHGPAPGFSLLQAYIAVREPEPAQHVLDLLYALNRPDLQERLFGFSNVIADMISLGADGTPPGASPEAGSAAGGPPDAAQPRKIEMASISKPIWFYGLEDMGGLLPSKAENLRRVAFAQLAVPGLADFAEVMKRPEEELGRLSRGIPLWLAETLSFSTSWTGIAAVATLRREHYGLFNAEWTHDNVRQLVETSGDGFDYVFTGALWHKDEAFELLLNLWEVKKFRMRKTFTLRWTPATADKALAEFYAQWRAFMEFKAFPVGEGMAYEPPQNLLDYIEALGACLTLFLVEKQVLPPAQALVPAELAARLGAGAAQSDVASLLTLSLHARARRLALPGFESLPPLATTTAVDQARQIVSS